MQKPKIPRNEVERQRVLDSYHILDSFSEQSFDDLTLIASQICQTPIALISLVDKDRQWFKSKYGLDASETHRDISFCGHAINEPTKIFEVSDAKNDERFADNPLVTGEPEIGFYAGVPLMDSEGIALGTLCVIGHEIKKLTKDQKKAMKALAREVMDRLRLAKTNYLLNQKVDAGKEEIREIKKGVEHEIDSRTEGLRFVKERLELAFKGTNEGVLDWVDVSSKKQWWSPKFHELIGYEVGEIEQSITSFLTILLHPNDAENISSQIQICLEEGKAFDVEFRLKSKSGEYKWYRGKGNRSFNADGSSVRMTGSVTDINKEKLLEIKLSETERFLKKVMGIAPSIIYVFSHESMSNEFSNKEIGKVLGYSTKEIRDFRDQLFPTLCHPDDLNKVFMHLGKIQELEDGKTVSIEYRMKHKNGSYKWLFSEDTAFERKENGEIKKHIGIAVDITKLKSVQEKLETKTKLLKRQNEDLKQLSYVATHDLKGPMISISGHFEFIKDEIKNPEAEVAESIEFVEEGINQFNRTLKGLNDAIKLKELAIKKEIIDLSEIIDTVIPTFKNKVEQLNGKLEVDLRSQTKVKGTSVYMVSVLQNLLSNSIKYRSKDRAISICIKSFLEDNFFVLTIEDNGSGINMQRNKGRVFKMFNRFHANIEGNGMGLYLVKNMVEKMGGDVKIESEEDKGTKFIIRLKPENKT